MASNKLQKYQTHLPDWVQDWLDVIVPALHIVLIVVVAWLVQRLLRKLLNGMAERYDLPHALLVPAIGVIRWLIFSAALLLVLERLGVSATVLWSAFTGFATVGAVAFFAAWSVLSNLFCALLIFTVGPFRVGDTIELLDTAEKPGAKGRVIDINLLYTTLEDFNSPSGQSLLKSPMPWCSSACCAAGARAIRGRPWHLLPPLPPPSCRAPTKCAHSTNKRPQQPQRNSSFDSCLRLPRLA